MIIVREEHVVVKATAGSVIIVGEGTLVGRATADRAKRLSLRNYPFDNKIVVSFVCLSVSFRFV